MKPSEQVRTIGGQFEVTNHTLFNKIAMMLSEQLKAAGVPVQMVGRVNGDKEIEAALMGTVECASVEDKQDMKSKVETVMASIKNPDVFVSKLG